MSDKRDFHHDPDRPTVYQITLKGQLSGAWADWFGGMSVTLTEDGDTLLTGAVTDQAALHGLLKKVRDLGLPLLSLQCVAPDQRDDPDANRFTHIPSGDGT
jgi:hypothetical protein